MPKPDVRRFLRGGLTGLAGIACAACCAIPFLLAAGVLGGAGWAAAGWIMPGVAVALTALAGAAWWWASSRRHTPDCAGSGCTCGQGTAEAERPVPVRSDP